MLQGNQEYVMRKRSSISLAVLFVAAATLSGCIFPYWGDEGGGYRGGGHYEGRHYEGGHHEGGGRHYEGR
jgi:hypothetical protein